MIGFLSLFFLAESVYYIGGKMKVSKITRCLLIHGNVDFAAQGRLMCDTTLVHQEFISVALGTIFNPQFPSSSHLT